MHGNAAEWTLSSDAVYPYRPLDGRNAQVSEGRKVVRGASSLGVAADRRDTFRLPYHWWQGVWNVGFRIVCEAELIDQVVVSEK